MHSRTPEPMSVSTISYVKAIEQTNQSLMLLYSFFFFFFDFALDVVGLNASEMRRFHPLNLLRPSLLELMQPDTNVTPH